MTPLFALLPGSLRRALDRAYTGALNLADEAAALVRAWRLATTVEQAPAWEPSDEEIEKLASLISSFRADGTMNPPLDVLRPLDEGGWWSEEEIAASNAAYHRRTADALRAVLRRPS